MYEFEKKEENSYTVLLVEWYKNIFNIMFKKNKSLNCRRKYHKNLSSILKLRIF